MRVLLVFISIAVLVFNASCGDNFESDLSKSGIYSNTEIGWEIKVPLGYKGIPTPHRKRWLKIGLGVNNAKHLSDDVHHLLGICKNEKEQFTSLISNTEPISNYPGVKSELDFARQYSANQSKIFNRMNFNSVVTTHTADTIQGVLFRRIDRKFVSFNDSVLFNQSVYLKFIDKQILEVVITSQHQRDHDELIKSFQSSRFSSL
ncbi:MAG: hypothetical protein HRT72_05620 [Flavobacteriales bacterium]|nr:hypothetical protein [Flavobacteriales bacterium]